MARDSDGCHLNPKTEPEVASPYFPRNSARLLIRPYKLPPIHTGFHLTLKTEPKVKMATKNNPPTPKLRHKPILQPGTVEAQTK